MTGTSIVPGILSTYLYMVELVCSGPLIILSATFDINSVGVHGRVLGPFLFSPSVVYI